MYKLLLVDDEPIIRVGIRNMLPIERLGIEVTGICANALDALDCMTDNMPDILITDLKMPKMDGLELIERTIKMYPRIQAIILSGFDEFEYARKAIKLGVKEYLLKPCDKKELESALERVCTDIDMQREREKQSLGKREAQIHVLTDQLMQLGSTCKSEEQLHRELQKLAKMNRNEEMLVEALIRLVAVAEKMIVSAQWQVELIQSIFNRKDENMLDCIAQILLQIYSVKVTRRPFVEDMCFYIKEHYMEPDMSLQYVADHVVFMNADYIGKEFAHDMGMKFSRYLLEERMKHARKLISTETTMPLWEVADRVGFGDNPQYFSLMFKKVSGVTPKEFRDRVISERMKENSEI